MEKIKFTELQSLATGSLNLSSIVPIVQDGENYQIALSSITSSVDGYDDSEIVAMSSNWDSTYSTVLAESAGWGNDQQTITSSSGVLNLDVSLGESAVTHLTENITSFTISNAVSGDNGMIIISSDGGGHTFPADVSPSIVATGDLTDIATLTNSVSSRITMGWYYDGEFNYLYVSNAIT